MIKRLLIAVALIVPQILVAQVPNEEQIFEQISDPDSQYYYPNLKMRFEVGDTTLMTNDYHYLYYGAVYQADYAPLSNNKAMDDVIKISSTLNPANPTVESLDNVVIATSEALKMNPFSPQLWNLLAFAYGSLGDQKREVEAFDRVQKILQTIENSGSGISERHPKHIIMFDHAVDFLNAKGIGQLPARVVSRTVEFIPFLTRKEYEGERAKGLYFDFERIYRNKPEDAGERKGRSWQINNSGSRSYK